MHTTISKKSISISQTYVGNVLDDNLRQFHYFFSEAAFNFAASSWNGLDASVSLISVQAFPAIFATSEPFFPAISSAFFVR